MQSTTKRIAMWSGPRNLSTAMMYSFGARADTGVWDEPFYVAYLRLTGLDHPMRDQILQAGEADPARVVAACLGEHPDGTPVFFQKHMAQHMIAGVARDWTTRCENLFLIRDPARVIASYHVKREDPVLDDLGFAQQVELFDQLRTAGKTPVVVDSTELRSRPEPFLRAICDGLGIPFDPAMLRWPAGGHRHDGVWASHWYGAVHQSTGFAPERAERPDLPAHLQPILQDAQAHYDHLAAHRIRV